MNLDVNFVLVKAIDLSELTAGVDMSNPDYFCIAYKFKVHCSDTLSLKKESKTALYFEMF